MRVRTEFLVVLLLIPIFFVPFTVTTVQGEHNLEWAIQPGDVFNYTITGFSDNPTNNFTYRSYALVTNTPILSDNASESYNMQLSRGSHYELYFENGTEDYSESQWTAFPVGNLSLLIELFSSSEIEFFELSTVFGFAVYSGDHSFTRTYTFVFSKSTGVLVQFLLEVYESYLGQKTLLEQILDGYTSTEVWEAENPENEDGLYWGLDTGDIINYTYTESMPDTSEVELGLTMEIIFLPVIPDEITAPYQILLNEGSLYMYLENGTEIEQSFYFPLTAIAIGNWTVIHEIDISQWFMVSGEPEWIDDAQFFGFAVDKDYGNARVVTKFIFSKTDGALEQYLVEYYDEFSTRIGYMEILRYGSTVHTTQTTSTPITITSTPTTTSPLGIPFDLLIVVIGFVSLLIVVVIIVRERGNQ